MWHLFDDFLRFQPIGKLTVDYLVTHPSPGVEMDFSESLRNHWWARTWILNVLTIIMTQVWWLEGAWCRPQGPGQLLHQGPSVRYQCPGSWSIILFFDFQLQHNQREHCGLNEGCNPARRWHGGVWCPGKVFPSVFGLKVWLNYDNLIIFFSWSLLYLVSMI